MGRGHRKLLEQAGITSLEQLGRLDLSMAHRPRRLSPESFERLHHQARLQLEARSAPPRVEFIEPVEDERGLCRLPEPSEGDIFFDVEADRYAIDGTFHYLLGWIEVGTKSAPQFRGLWAKTRAEERRNFETFVDHVMERRKIFPDLHIYHFAPMERTYLGELMGRYASREDEVDDILRSGVLCDLLPVVKQGLRAGIESYSLKELEQLHGYQRRTDLRAAAQARRLFELARDFGSLDAEAELRETIENYNREDCVSTLHLRDWLEGQRRVLISRAIVVPRPAVKEDPPSEELTEWAQRVARVRARLLEGIPAEPLERSDGHNARQLLADLVDWHRREAKPGWWEHYRLRSLAPEQFIDESGPIGGLGEEIQTEKIARSYRFEHAFPPQDYSIKVGDSVECPITEQKLGTVLDIDRVRNVIGVKRSKPLERPALALVKCNDTPRANALKEALMEIAESLSASSFGLPVETSDWGVGDPTYPAARALLLRDPPKLAAGVQLQMAGEDASHAAIRVAPSLRGTVLPVQGPPGAGKTYTGSRMILALIAKGMRVGITALSHKVISNLLEGVHDAAAGAGEQVLSIQKADEPLDHPDNRPAKNTAEISHLLRTGEVQLAAGTAWVWCDPKMREAVDVLVVDEAGQFSLANTLAVSVAADSLVLLGDPQQLAQPSQGSHPPGAGASALEHLLGGEDTVPADRGLFLEHTWRLPPQVAAFTSEYFYAGRLEAHADCARQALHPRPDASRFAGSGLFYEEVEHTGNVQHCAEEAQRIVSIVADLLGQPGAPSSSRWVDRKGVSHDLKLNDILIVAPYNSQVHLLSETLLEAGYPDARVGTVDKFQGQEAPVVIYSMTTSHPEDAPRGFDFLFSLNRLNVATSRSQAIVILVASPRLLEADCKTPKQMRLVNGICGAVERAGAGVQCRAEAKEPSTTSPAVTTFDDEL